jgi:hypothetical protein
MSRKVMSEERKRQYMSRFTEDFDEVELREPDYITIIKLVWHAVKGFFQERPGQIIGSSFILIMLWGYHNELEIIKIFWKDWVPPGTPPSMRTPIIPWIPWDYEIISFWAGAFLLVVVPMILIKYVYKQSYSDYGLGIPPKGRRSLAFWSFVTLTLLSVPAFYLGAQDEGMRQLYPFFKSFSSPGEFIIYELTYLPFFIAIEFIFRGYLLFGLAGVRDEEIRKAGGGIPGVFYFHKYALLIQMLSYTAWHLGKPLPELWGTLFWGLAAGTLAYASHSIWPIVFSHWLLNVFLDALIIEPF